MPIPTLARTTRSAIPSHRPPAVIYLITFLTALHLALPLYVNSTFLATHLTERTISLVYTISALLTILVLALLPAVLRRVGNYRMLMGFLLVKFVMLTLLVLAFLPTYSPLVVAGAAVMYLLVSRMLFVHLDIFLEDSSEDATTGSTRGLYYTILNFGILIAPLIAGFIIGAESAFWRLYLLAAVFIVPLFWLISRTFHSFTDPPYPHRNVRDSLKELLQCKPLYCISIANFLLFFFYAWMVIYLPLYLTQMLGFSWDQLGVIFTIMLLPFVLFELPSGRLADTRWGEKELLTAGFIIMALSTALLSFITTPSMALWAAALFLTRTGASLVEIMCETYFFNQVDSTDAHLISLFRMTRPLAYLLAPLAALLFFTLADIQYLFLALGAIMLIGVRYSLAIEDTR